jgi:hypothetical protein
MEIWLDGNGVAGLLGEVFGAEVTAVVRACGSCGTEAAVGAHRAYRGAGVVLRCPGCGGGGGRRPPPPPPRGPAANVPRSGTMPRSPLSPLGGLRGSPGEEPLALSLTRLLRSSWHWHRHRH